MIRVRPPVLGLAVGPLWMPTRRTSGCIRLLQVEADVSWERTPCIILPSFQKLWIDIHRLSLHVLAYFHSNAVTHLILLIFQCRGLLCPCLASQKESDDP